MKIYRGCAPAVSMAKGCSQSVPLSVHHSLLQVNQRAGVEPVRATLSPFLKYSYQNNKNYFCAK